MWLLWLASCASLVGLEELDTLPAAFPLTISGETGHITTPPAGGQVAVDVVWETEEEARESFSALRAQAEGKGFALHREGRVDKRDQVVLEKSGERLTLGCCPARADRRRLVFVKWEEAP